MSNLLDGLVTHLVQTKVFEHESNKNKNLGLLSTQIIIIIIFIEAKKTLYLQC